MGFEADCKAFVEKHEHIHLVEDNTNSVDKIDFILELNKKRFALDCKVKNRTYREKWHELLRIPEKDTFIFDETAIKKLFSEYPYGFMLIFNKPDDEHIVFNCLDLLFIPRKRINRLIEKNQKRIKGKWVVNLNWGHRFESMVLSFDYMAQFIANDLEKRMKQLECYEIPDTEKILTLDKEYSRKPYYWTKDLSEK